jgi:hypothetical protein
MGTQEVLLREQRIETRSGPKRYVQGMDSCCSHFCMIRRCARANKQQSFERQNPWWRTGAQFAFVSKLS